MQCDRGVDTILPKEHDPLPEIHSGRPYSGRHLTAATLVQPTATAACAASTNKKCHADLIISSTGRNTHLQQGHNRTSCAGAAGEGPTGKPYSSTPVGPVDSGTRDGSWGRLAGWATYDGPVSSSRPSKACVPRVRRPDAVGGEQGRMCQGVRVLKGKEYKGGTQRQSAGHGCFLCCTRLITFR